MAEHSKNYPLSASHRWIKGACPRSVRMSQGYPEIVKPYAERGTAAHELGEFCASLGINVSETIGLVFNNIPVDHKMIDDVSIYVSYLQQQATLYQVKPLLEQRVCLSSTGRDDVFGTSDCVFIIIRNGIVEIIDYKNGYGLVEVTNNSQLIGYAIGALDTFNLWDKVTHIKTTIVQPNGNHIDGPIRSCFYSIEMMRQWVEIFKESIALSLDKTQLPNAGEWCYWCDAQANCRARTEWVLDHAYVNVPFDELSIPELELIYNNIGGIKAFIEKVEQRVLSLALSGKQFSGYKVVNAYGRAKCSDEQKLVQVATSRGVNIVDMYKTELKSKTDLKRILPKDVVDEFFVTPEPGRKLVPLTDKSPALRVQRSAEGVFDGIKIN